MLFKCKVCSEKDQRITDLKAQVHFLLRILHPSQSMNFVPSVHLEADGVLSGQQHIVEIPDSQLSAEFELVKQAEEERSERDRILSGTYDY